jgi:hypothetical protein
MKLTSIAILITLFALHAVAQPANNAPHKHISILSVSKEVFYFKTDADFMGATVVVTDSTGTVFFSAELHSKRNLIDFFYLENGQYTIHFEHNGVVEDYQVWLDKKSHEISPFVALKPHA